MKTNFLLVKFLTITLLFIANLSYAQLNEQWLSTYNGANNAEDHVYALCTDDDGNSYVTGRVNGVPPAIYKGYEVGTVKYSPTGQQLWASVYNVTTPQTDDMGRAITIDNSGNVYVAATIDQGFEWWIVVIKYNSSGVQQWVQEYNSAGDFDEAYSMTSDDEGNIYVAGATSGSSGRDMLVVKYNPSGIQQWAQVYNGPGNYWDEVYEVRYKSGAVYAAGYSTGNTSTDMTVLKYNTSGTLLWEARYDGDYNSNLPDFGDGLYIDNSSNVYITGFTQTASGRFDYLTVKYNTSGTQQWASIYTSGVTASSWAYGITGDASGNIYVTGYSDATPASTNISTVKYNSSGVQQWVQTYNSGYGRGICIDAAGDINVIGSVMSQFAVIQYAPDGTGKDAYIISGNGRGREITADGSAIYAAGWDNGNFAMIKFDKDGPTGITNNGTGVPGKFSLSQNYPNPFNPSTSINFDIPEASNVQIIVYNSLGKQAAVLVNNHLAAGSYKAQWNAEGFTSGVYYYKLVTNSFTETKKMLLIK